MAIQTVCVFLASRKGNNPVFSEATRKMGTLLAQRKVATMYGGETGGLMGILAEAVLAAGGRLDGAILRDMVDGGTQHPQLTSCTVWDTLAERKQYMMAHSDAFIVMPGGVGTLDELSEVLALRSLSTDTKPCILMNIDGYYDALLAFLTHACQSALMDPSILSEHDVVQNVDDLRAVLQKHMIGNACK